jgi:hypothetical protein
MDLDKNNSQTVTDSKETTCKASPKGKDVTNGLTAVTTKANSRADIEMEKVC